MSRSRTIAIGDIHGCAAALVALLEQIEPQPKDTIVTLGDYIDRGTDSRGVVERLLLLNGQCELVPLIGNHEAMLLSALDDAEELAFWCQCGGMETLESYGGEIESIPESHIEFFEQCSIAYETDTHLFVHANYEADRPLEEQDEHVLLWKHLNYGVPSPHVSGKKVVVGHTPQTSGEVFDAGHLICIDTFCFGDGWLTAFDVESEEIWQANKFGEVKNASDGDSPT